MPIWLFFGAPLGTNIALSTLDFVYNGSPFCWVPSKTSISLSTLDYYYNGAPFVSYAKG
jgi:hypothetical protein